MGCLLQRQVCIGKPGIRASQVHTVRSARTHHALANVQGMARIYMATLWPGTGEQTATKPSYKRSQAANQNPSAKGRAALTTSHPTLGAPGPGQSRCSSASCPQHRRLHSSNPQIQPERHWPPCRSAATYSQAQHTANAHALRPFGRAGFSSRPANPGPPPHASCQAACGFVTLLAPAVPRHWQAVAAHPRPTPGPHAIAPALAGVQLACSLRARTCTGASSHASTLCNVLHVLCTLLPYHCALSLRAQQLVL